MSIVAEPFLRTLQDSDPLLPAGRHVQRRLHGTAARVLWSHLQDGRLGGAHFRRQHLVGPYLAEFVCMDAGLVIELAGTPGAGVAAHDEARRAFFQGQGFQVLRLRDRDVLVDTRSVLEAVRQALFLSSSPQLSASPAES